MAYQNLIYEKKARIGSIVLNRPAFGNSINGALADEIQSVSRQINEDDEIRVVVLTGSGVCFCSGEQTSELHDPLAARMASEAVAGLCAPVIAAINGDALGTGLEVALACDIRLASKEARFGLTAVSYGSIPTAGGTQRLPLIVGRGKALELIITAEIITAPEAHRIGLVNRITALDELRAEAENLANKLASKGPIALRYAKEAINKGLDMPLPQGLGLEADLSLLLQSTADRDEGIRAFLEKREAHFKGA